MAWRIGLISGVLVVVSVSCAERAGSGNSVRIPSVRVECTTAGCRGTGALVNAFAVYTTSSCSNPSFGETASGSASVFCSSSGCTGIITIFVGSRGQPMTSIPDGTYAVCVTVDRDQNYSGTHQAGDSYGTLSTNLLIDATSSVTVSAFTDL